MSKRKGGGLHASINPTLRYKRMSLIIDPDLHHAFKLITTAQGKEMSQVLIQFIKDYVEKHAPAVRLSKKGGRQ